MLLDTAKGTFGEIERLCNYLKLSCRVFLSQDRRNIVLH